MKIQIEITKTITNKVHVPADSDLGIMVKALTKIGIDFEYAHNLEGEFVALSYKDESCNKIQLYFNEDTFQLDQSETEETEDNYAA